MTEKVWVLANYYIGPHSTYSGSGNTDFAAISIHKTKEEAIQKVIEEIDELEQDRKDDWSDEVEEEEQQEQIEHWQREKDKCIQKLREEGSSWPVPYNNYTYMFHISEHSFE